jgi:hypothetical protein
MGDTRNYSNCICEVKLVLYRYRYPTFSDTVFTGTVVKEIPGTVSRKICHKKFEETILLI